MPTGRVRVGVSGWTYRAWRGDFYPAGLVHRRELAYLAGEMDTVEVNGTFYSLQRGSSFERWRDETPDDFVFALKGGRFVTHLKRLGEPDQGLANFFASGPLALGSQLGPILWQLPDTLAFDAPLLEGFCRALPGTVGEAVALTERTTLATDRVLTTTMGVPGSRALRHAVEPRHRSFDSPQSAALLREYGVALVVSDCPHAWPVIDRDTAGFRYVRLHGHTDLYASSYSAASLASWGERCYEWAAGGQDVYVYFDNDAQGAAPHNAVDLAARVRALGSST